MDVLKKDKNVDWLASMVRCSANFSLSIKSLFMHQNYGAGKHSISFSILRIEEGIKLFF